MPVLGRTHRRLQNPAPHQFGDALIKPGFMKVTLNKVKGLLSNRQIDGVFEFESIRMFEDRTQGSRGFGAQVFRFVGPAHKLKQHTAHIVVNNDDIACEPGGVEQIGCAGCRVAQDLTKRCPGILRPVPGAACPSNSQGPGAVATSRPWALVMRLPGYDLCCFLPAIGFLQGHSSGVRRKFSVLNSWKGQKGYRPELSQERRNSRAVPVLGAAVGATSHDLRRTTLAFQEGAR